MGDIPADLDQMEPGLLLALFLSTADELDKTGYDHTVLLAAYQKMISHYQAKLYEEMTAVFDSLDRESGLSYDELFEGAAMEIGSPLHLTRRSAENDLDFALDLCQRLPRVLQALAAGQIDTRRARVMIHETANLPEDTARQIVDQTIDEAGRLTSGQLHARLRKLSMQADPEHGATRYQAALADRRVVTEAGIDGTTHLYGLDLPTERVAAAMEKINALARSLKTFDDERTLDQIRADVLLDLLDGRPGAMTNSKGVVDLHVDLATLARLSEHPGELAGYGPVVADIARQVAETQTGGQWRWTLTDPDTCRVLSNGTTRRRPTKSQRRQIEAQQPTCIFPGCRIPARKCDLDHRQPWSHGGNTCPHNLEPLCRHHHRIRHQHNWTHQPLPDGDHLWISSLGRRYKTSGRSP